MELGAAPSPAAAWRARIRGILGVGLLFAVSVAVRVPLLDHPLGETEHQWLPSTVLRTLRIWSDEGAVTPHRFLPIMTYGAGANRFIDNQSRIVTPEGLTYYTSYPPLAYLAAYLAIRPFDPEFSLRSLRVFCLGLELLCVVLLYLTVAALLDRCAPRTRQLASFTAVTLYLFSAYTLWFHCHVYMSDMFVQPLFLATLWAFTRWLQAPPPARRWAALLGVLLLLMVLTEWLGLLSAAVLAVFALKHRQRPGAWSLFAAACLAPPLGLALVLAHYAGINGLTPLLTDLFRKFAERSGMGSEADPAQRLDSIDAWTNILRWYYRAYFPTYLYLVPAAVVARWRLGRRFHQLFDEASSHWRPVLALALFPALLHHALLFNFTAAHWFSVLKTAPLLALLGGLLTAAIARRSGASLPAPVARRWTNVLGFCLLLSCVVGVGDYYRRFARVDARFQKLGNQIAHAAEADQVIFIAGLAADEYLYPQIVLYAGRNLARWQDETAAAALLKRNGATRGLIATIDRQHRLHSLRHFSLPNLPEKAARPEVIRGLKVPSLTGNPLAELRSQLTADLQVSRRIERSRNQSSAARSLPAQAPGTKHWAE